MSRVNFIPSSMLGARRRRDHLRRWAAAAIAAACTTIVPLVLNEIGRAQAGELRDKQVETASALSKARKEVEADKLENTKLQGRIDRARALRTKRAWSAMFVMIGNCLPRGAWLSSIATDPAAPSSGGSAALRPARGKGKQPEKPAAETVRIEAPQQLVLNGFAAEHAHLYAFISNLKGTDVFSDVKLLRSGAEESADREVVGFTLTCAWEPE